MAKEKKREVKIKVTGKFTAWSFSRFRDHDQCPYRAGLKHLMKVKEPGSPALDRGDRIHKAASAYVSGVLKKLDAELKPVTKTIAIYRDAMKAGLAKVDDRWCVNKSWRPVDFFAYDAWLRMITDYHAHEGNKAAVTDYKTGKVSQDREFMFYQLELYAIGTFLTKPKVDEVETRLLYTDHNVEQKEVYRRSQLASLQRAWVKRTIPLLTDTKFEPEPGNHCRWCPHSASKNGPCIY